MLSLILSYLYSFICLLFILTLKIYENTNVKVLVLDILSRKKKKTNKLILFSKIKKKCQSNSDI